MILHGPHKVKIDKRISVFQSSKQIEINSDNNNIPNGGKIYSHHSTNIQISSLISRDLMETTKQ